MKNSIKIKEWIRLYKNLRQDLQDYQDIFVCHFPDENDKNQCAKGAYMYLLIGRLFFGLRIYGFKLYVNDKNYLGKDYIMSTSPKAMLFPGFLPESLEKIQLIL